MIFKRLSQRLQGYRPTSLPNALFALQKPTPLLSSHLRSQQPMHRHLSTQITPPALHPIPRLSVIDRIVERVSSEALTEDLQDVYLIGVQHNLETTATLFEAFIRLGFKPHNMRFIGKPYSTAPSVAASIRALGVQLEEDCTLEKIGNYSRYFKQSVRRMWDNCLVDLEMAAKRGQPIKKLIILDEGGHARDQMPGEARFSNYEIASVEHTRGGLYSEAAQLLSYPLVEVASSAVKQGLEPYFIADAVVTQVQRLLQTKQYDRNSAIFGVVGNGAIGAAVADYLLSQGYKVLVYDEDPLTFEGIAERKNCNRMGDIRQLITSASHIFGCTGKDITKEIQIRDLVKKPKIFISCSSEDREFLSFLKEISQEAYLLLDPRMFNPLHDIICLSSSGEQIYLLGGGFPINFDRQPWHIPKEGIIGTQGLLLWGVLQANTIAHTTPNDGITPALPASYMLDPFAQQSVVKDWLAGDEIPTLAHAKEDAEQRDYEKLIKPYEDIDWVKQHSGGEFKPNPWIQQHLSQPAHQEAQERDRASETSKPMI